MKRTYQCGLPYILLFASFMVYASHSLPECLRNLRFQRQKRYLSRRFVELTYQLDEYSQSHGAKWDPQHAYNEIMKKRNAVKEELRTLEENHKKN